MTEDPLLSRAVCMGPCRRLLPSQDLNPRSGHRRGVCKHCVTGRVKSPPCSECGRPLGILARSDSVVCSAGCRTAKRRRLNPIAAREDGNRRRAALAQATVEAFSAADMTRDWGDHELQGCFFCGCTLTTDNLQVEHFYPLQPAADVPQGHHALWNLVPACAPCNQSKGNRDPWAFLERALAERGIDLDACLETIDAVMRRRRTEVS
ncbi:HNH endonuclease [Streptomyces lydicus]|uniref:HNH endonuclease n=1 Tax=Streptomyces lydicus TaxID=47763 RepID=UPI0037A551A5